MKVVLTQKVEKLGARGDIRTVKDGYGRNFLLPEMKAVLVGTHMAKNILREVEEKRAQKKQAQANKPQAPAKLSKPQKRQLKKKEKEAKKIKK